MPAASAGRRSPARTLLLWAAPLAWLGCGGGGGTDIVLPSLSVTTATDGVELDPDGYNLLIDGSQSRPIGVAATLVVDRLTDGPHEVELSGLAANCSAQGENPQSITVRSGATSNVSFAVRCSASTGSIEVATSTTGSGSDPDGFTLMVDAAPWGPIGAAATASVAGLPPGSHMVGLSGLAANCQVSGENPRQVAVSPGEVAVVPFTVTCSETGPAPGTLNVSASTSGSNLDPDGYGVSVDGGAGQPLGVSAAITLPAVSAGQHSVQLTGVAANCTVGGTNPRTVSVSAAGTVNVAFTITCTSTGPTTGSIEITSTTTGTSPDPDGYTVRLDGGSAQPIGANGSRSVTNLSPGSHSVRLAGVAANCTLSGDNPRSVTVTAGQSSAVAFAVACTTPAPTTGSISIAITTSGTSPDPNGYTVSLDGGNAQPIGANETRSVDNLSPGSHSVRLAGVAANCTLSGDNPRSVSVTAGQSSAVAFTVACATPTTTTGNLTLRVTTSGPSPDQDGYTVRVDGGNPQSLEVNGTRTVQNLAAGTHSALLGDIASNCTAASNPQTAVVAAGGTATILFQVSCVSTGPSVNFRIQGMYLTQSTQDLDEDVPLVEGRNGYLRVFVTASGPNNLRPDVRVRISRGGNPVQTLTIEGGTGSTPTALQEGSLQSSWNVRVSGNLIQGGLALLADVDPGNAVAETSETDNSFPASGNPQALEVQSVPAAAITFVPIRQAADNSVGTVGNHSQMLDLAQRLYPLNSISTASHAEFTVEGPLEPIDATQWNQTVSDLEALRVAENPGRTYVGMVKLSYGSGTAGSSFYTPGTATAVVTDDPRDVRQVMAHELGHTFGQLHTPCGTPPGVDPGYPYRGGIIGVYGMDVESGDLKALSLPDIMGYCPDPWISDYTYRKVLSYRRANPLRAGSAAQPTLMVWGHIGNGQVVLEPAFQLVTRPHLPAARGPYSLEARGTDGSNLFSLSFDASTTADDPQGTRHFVFAVPLSPEQAARLGSVRVSGPGIQARSLTKSAALLQAGAASNDVITEADPEGVTLRWDARAHPMIMVRDPDTGEVLSFARGGRARVWTRKGTVDLEVSNGLQSQRLRRAIKR